MPDAVTLPDHRYVPGKTARHPEGSFDALRASVRPGAGADDLAKTAAFQHGLRYLEAGFYWESHEVLEPVWMALPDGSPERNLVQGLIQLANGRLKLVMDRPNAARRLAALSRDLVAGVPHGRAMGIDPGEILRHIDSLAGQAEQAL